MVSTLETTLVSTLETMQEATMEATLETTLVSALESTLSRLTPSHLKGFLITIGTEVSTTVGDGGGRTL